MYENVPQPFDFAKLWRRFARLTVADTCAWIVAAAFWLTLSSPDPDAGGVATAVGFAPLIASGVLLLFHVLWIVVSQRVHKRLRERGLTATPGGNILLASVALAVVAPFVAVPYALWAFKNDAAGMPVPVAAACGNVWQPLPVMPEAPRASLTSPLLIAGVITAVVAGAAGFGGIALVAYAADTYTARDAADAAIDDLSSDLAGVGGAVTSEDSEGQALVKDATEKLREAEDLFDEASFFSADEYDEATELAQDGSKLVADLSGFADARNAASTRIDDAQAALDKAELAAEPKSTEAKQYADAKAAYEAAVAAFGNGTYADKDGMAQAEDDANTALTAANQINTRVENMLADARSAGNDWACYMAYLKLCETYPRTAEAKEALTSAESVAPKAVKAYYDGLKEVLDHNAAWAKDPMTFQHDGWVELPKMTDDQTLKDIKACKTALTDAKMAKDLCKLNSALYEAAWAGNQFRKIIKRLEDEATTSGNSVTYYYDNAMQRQMNDLCSKMRTNLNTAKDTMKAL